MGQIQRHYLSSLLITIDCIRKIQWLAHINYFFHETTVRLAITSIHINRFQQFVADNNYGTEASSRWCHGLVSCTYAPVSVYRFGSHVRVPAAQRTYTPRSWDSPAATAGNTRSHLDRSVANKQTISESDWLLNLGTDAGAYVQDTSSWH